MIASNPPSRYYTKHLIYTSFHLIITGILWGHYYHFTNEKGTQRYEMPCSHDEWIGKKDA